MFAGEVPRLKTSAAANCASWWLLWSPPGLDRLGELWILLECGDGVLGSVSRTPTGILFISAAETSELFPEGSVTIIRGFWSWLTGVTFLGGVGLLLDTDGADGEESGVMGVGYAACAKKCCRCAAGMNELHIAAAAGIRSPADVAICGSRCGKPVTRTIDFQIEMNFTHDIVFK